MPLRYRNPKPKRPCEEHKLPWGYDAPSKKTTPLKDFITYITDKTIKPAEEGRFKSVLVYWDRGTISSGDEAKMAELGIDSDRYFAHVLDIQEWYQVAYPKGQDGKQKHGLKEAAKIMNIGTINQRELDNVDEVARPYLYGAMLHCAGGDAEITLRLFMEIVMRKIKDLNEEDEGKRKLRDDFCFVGLDFEGGGRIGQGTTEIGLSLLYSDCLSAEEDYLPSITNRHAIIWEMLADHISLQIQAGRMDVDEKARETYPRWNFQGGPNSTEKDKFCYFKRYNSVHKVFEILVDTEIVYMKYRAWWILHQIPGFSRVAAQIQYPVVPAPALWSFQTCNHAHHNISSNLPMRAPEEEEDYNM